MKLEDRSCEVITRGQIATRTCHELLLQIPRSVGTTGDTGNKMYCARVQEKVKVRYKG